MILAAGYGKRLKPLTDTKPKALIEICGKPMLYWIIEKLVNHGFNKIVINIHHHSDMMLDAINKSPYKADISISKESDHLLDTGGGIFNAKQWLEGTEPFLVHNVDNISNINLKELYSYHLQHGGIATLASSHRKFERCFLWNNNKLAGWENNTTGEEALVNKTNTNLVKKGFSGIHVVNPEVFKLVKYTGKFSMNKVYLDLAKEKDIFSYDHDQKYWFDLGTIEKIKRAEKIISENPGMFL